MTRETKAGLLMILMLGGVFGFMVYKRMHQPAAAMAQQNPTAVEPPETLEPTGSASGAADPFLAGGDDIAGSNKIIQPAATERSEGRFDAGTTAGTASNSRPSSESDPFEKPAVVATRAKPRLPTEIPREFGDDVPTKARVDRRSRSTENAAAARQFPVPDATPKSRNDDINPAAGADRGASRNKVASRTVTTATNEADPFGTETRASSDDGFGAPVKAASAKDEMNFSDFPEGNSAGDSDNRSPAALNVPTTADSRESADPFGDATLEVQRPVTPPPNRNGPHRIGSQGAAAQVNESADNGFAEPKLSVPAATLEPNIDDAFDQVPSRPAINERPVAKDDRFGGFRPATTNDTASNAFPDDERSTRRAPRPAPVKQIDEDFGSAASNRPLIAGDNYQVEPNDNYWTISRKKYGSGRYFLALAKHNAQVITDPKRMKPGVTIATPSADSLERAYPQLIPKTATIDPVQTASIATTVHSTAAIAIDPEANAGYFVSNDGVPMYRVGKEDTLSGISQRHLGRSSRWVQVFEMNRDVLTDGNTLKIGAVLRLPSDASRVEVVSGARTYR